jgi:hypothetical protein
MTDDRNERAGILLHAKHALMPNKLGYCGPDDRGEILRHLQDSETSPKLLKLLKSFDAAYPFINLIGKSTGKDPFDYRVPEAYWIGNDLLAHVSAPDFYTFSHATLKNRKRSEVKKVFKTLGPRAMPHHSFYVMSTYATSSVADGPSASTDSAKKIGALIDNCRISLGRVTKVGRKDLTVSYRPVGLEGGRLEMLAPRTKKVAYESAVRPFGSVKAGDWVSLHWDFACDVLSLTQARNLTKFTSADLAAANELLKRLHSR